MRNRKVMYFSCPVALCPSWRPASSPAEMLPARRLQLVPFTVLIDQNDVFAADNSPDLRDRHSSDPGWHLLPRWSRKYQFVVFSAVQCRIEINLVARFADLRPRDCFRIDFCSHATLFADMGEIGGKPVTGVDHRGNQASLPQTPSGFHSWCRIKVSRKILWREPRPAVAKQEF